MSNKQTQLHAIESVLAAYTDPRVAPALAKAFADSVESNLGVDLGSFIDLKFEAGTGYVPSPDDEIYVVLEDWPFGGLTTAAQALAEAHRAIQRAKGER